MTTPQPASTPWQLVVARIAAVLISLMQLFGLFGVAAILVQNGSDEAYSGSRVSLGLIHALTAFVTLVLVFRAPRAAWVGFLALLTIHIAFVVLLREWFAGFPMALLLEFYTVAFGVTLYGGPLALLVIARGRLRATVPAV